MSFSLVYPNNPSIFIWLSSLSNFKTQRGLWIKMFVYPWATLCFCANIRFSM